MYFSSEPKLQGEYLEEVQALDYDFLISIEGELSEPGNNLNGNEKERLELGNENAGELDLSGINLDHSGDERDEDLENELWINLHLYLSHYKQLIRQTNYLLRMVLLQCLNHQENNYHCVKPQGFPNPHMNPNFLVKLNIP